MGGRVPKDFVMLLWLQYLKQLELAVAAAADSPPGGAPVVKTMCELRTIILATKEVVCVWLTGVINNGERMALSSDEWHGCLFVRGSGAIKKTR